MDAKKSPKIVFAGTTDNASAILESLAANGYQIVLVLTRQDAPFGRRAVLTPSPVATVAEKLGLPILKANRIGPTENQFIGKFNAELGVVVAFGSLLKKATLDLLRLGWLNVHFSELPAYRGAAPVQRAILAGDKRTGVTIFRLDEGMDTGPIAAFESLGIYDDETSGELLTRLTKLGEKTLLALLDRGIENLTFVEQPNDGFSTAPKIVREDARLDPTSESSTQMHNKVRAMNPEPMAWLLFNEQPLRVLAAKPGPNIAGQPGNVSTIGGQILLQCAEQSTLELLQVQPSGKRPMSGESWLNGVQGKGRVILK